MPKRGAGTAGPDLEPLMGLLRLLSDRTRLNILLLLARGERNVTSLCDELALPQPTVSHHLGVLRRNNLIDNRRHGKLVFYGLNGSSVSSSSRGDLIEVALDAFALKIVERVA